MFILTDASRQQNYMCYVAPFIHSWFVLTVCFCVLPRQPKEQIWGTCRPENAGISAKRLHFTAPCVTFA